ncbi:hypothetical protein IMSHALPRED_005654 [Imshaugia aleurites]|uniref:Uncharacterized protein n=1 Tax=Imshaugia aleurites TaxID=172621 RepID=A0A8H3FD19_9LECA|nr:hypothetical protein IMSHALPRED_005654 [Imshaugia aleurites]
MANNRLPNPNRYITDNDADGSSFFSTRIPASVESPVSLSSNNDLERYQTALQTQVPLVTPAGGANVWYNDIPPDAESSLMHRTVSLDIVVLLIGQVQLPLSNNETRTIKPGDMVIQRSTLHKWRNPSKTQWARMVAIVSECQPYVTENGEALGAYFPGA